MRRRRAGERLRGSRRSILLPRQAFDAPSVARVAVVSLVQLALEAVEDVHHVPEPRLLERLARLERAVAAAPDEDHGPVVEVGPRDLLHLPHEMRVELP